MFYTAQSFRDAKEFEKSIEWYEKRSLVKSGFLEEIFISKFMIAKISEVIGKDKNYCLIKYKEAHDSDPLRGESIKSLIQMYHRLGDWENAYVYSLYGLRYNLHSPYPNRSLFLDSNIYDYEMLELHALSCYYTKRIDEGSRVYWAMRNQLAKLPSDYLNEDQIKRLHSNEHFFPRPHQKPTNKPMFSGANKRKKKKRKK